MMSPGRYHARLKEATTGKASTGTPQMALVFTVTHVQDGNAWAEIEPTERTVYVALTDAAWETSQQKLELLGFQGDFGTPKFREAVYAEGVELDCNEDEYKGKVRERWELVGWGTRRMAAAPADLTRQLNARWKAKAAPGTKPNGKPAAPPAAPGNGAARKPMAAPAGAPAVATAPKAAPAAGQAPAFQTRDGAWTALCEAWAAKKLTQAQLEERWADAIGKVAAKIGKPETEFSAADWGAVVDEGEIPF